MFKMDNIKTLQVACQDRRNCEKHMGRRFYCFDVTDADDIDTTQFTDYWFISVADGIVGVMSEEDATLIKLYIPESEVYFISSQKYTVHVPSNWSNQYLERMHGYANKRGWVKFGRIKYTLRMIENEIQSRLDEKEERLKLFNNLEDKLDHVSTKNLLKLYKGYRKTVALGYGHEHIMVAGVSISIENLRTILCFREHVE